jgi:hypothetical protein
MTIHPDHPYIDLNPELKPFWTFSRPYYIVCYIRDNPGVTHQGLIDAKLGDDLVVTVVLHTLLSVGVVTYRIPPDAPEHGYPGGMSSLRYELAPWAVGKLWSES